MNVLIDCGGFKGKTLSSLKKKYKGFKCYCFEPIKELAEIVKKSHPECKIYEKAVWVENIKKRLYLGKTMGHTLFKSKKTDEVGKRGFVMVDCIDFSQWIKNNFNKSDYIVLKMNIEGSEYKVLNRMLIQGTIDYINELYCEWHQHKIKSISKEVHEHILKEIKERNTRLC